MGAIGKGEVPKAPSSGTWHPPLKDWDSLVGKKSLVLVNGKLYLKCKLKGEAKTTVVFIVPKAHRRKAIDGCH